MIFRTPQEAVAGPPLPARYTIGYLPIAILLGILLTSGLFPQQSQKALPDSTAEAAVDSLYNHAQSLKSAGRFADSNRHMLRAARGYETLQLWEKAVNTYRIVGAYQKFISAYDSSRQYLAKTIELGKKHLHPQHKTVRRAIYQYRETLIYQKRLTDAIDFTLLHYPPPQGNRDAATASVYYTYGSYLADVEAAYDSAFYYLEQSLHHMKLGNSNWAAPIKVHRRLGALYRINGNFSRAHQHLDMAVELIERHEEGHKKESRLANLHISRGNVYLEEGDFLEAIENFRKSYDYWITRTPEERNSQLYVSYLSAALAYAALHRFPEAISLFNKSLEEVRLIFSDNSIDGVVIRLNLANALSKTGQYQQARENLAAAGDFLAKTPDKWKDEQLLYQSIAAEIYLGIGDFTTAAAFSDRAIDLGHKILGKEHPGMTDNYRVAGDISRATGQTRQALAQYHRAIGSACPGFSANDINILPSIESTVSPFALLEVLQRRAVILAEQFLENASSGNQWRDLALATIDSASVLLDRLRSNFRHEGSQLALGGKASELYHLAIEILAADGESQNDPSRISAIFHYAEKNRMAVLSNALNELRAIKYAGIPDHLLQEEARLRRAMLSGHTRLQQSDREKSAAGNERRGTLWIQYQQAKKGYFNLVKQLEKEYPAYYELKYRSDTPALAAVQQQIFEGEALLRYILTDKRLRLLIISTNNSQLLDLGTTEGLAEEIDQLIESLQKVSARNSFAAASHRLYQRLLQPAESLLDATDRWLIIPDGSLARIPFESLLQSMPQDPLNFTAMEFLIRRAEVRSHYSAGLMFARPRLRKTPPYLVGAFAPVFDTGKMDGSISVSSRFNFNSLDTFWASITRDGETIKKLPFSEVEVENIVDVFSGRTRRSHGFVRNSASEARFKENCGDYQILHLATHSFVDEETPALSGILFAESFAGGGKEDGILHAGEIYNLDLNAQLVVLSSCESGIGKLVAGEGLMAMTRGFIYAGVPKILVSLWKVSDRHTGSLMSAFYAGLADDKTDALALRAAKLQMLQDPLSAFPGYWSSFVLIGR